MIYRIYILIFSLFIASCQEAEQPQVQEYPATIDSLAWNPRAFPTGSKIQLSLSQDFESFVTGADENVFQDVFYMADLWDESVDFIQFFEPTIDIVPNLDYTNPDSYWDAAGSTQIGIYRSTNWFDSVPSEAVAITQFHAVADVQNGEAYYRIIHADIIFNDRDHDFSMDPNDKSNYHFPTVLLHELGHLLGLGHTFDMGSGSIMIPGFGPNYRQNILVNSDKQNLYRKYRKFKPSSGNVNFAVKAGSGTLRGKQIKRFIHYLKKNGECEHHDHTHQ
jgi:hypothetical protein